MPQLANSVYLIGFCRFEMSRKNPFLWMPNPTFFSNRDHFMDFIHIQIPSCSIVTFQQGGNGLVPTFQYPFFPWIFWIKIDTGFGASYGRTGHGKFYLHGFCQRQNLIHIQTFAHTRASSCCTSP